MPVLERFGLIIILLVYVALATAHSLIVPLTAGNDEWAHFLYARFIAEHGRLPTSLAEREDKNEAGTKSDDPPLYHLLVAAAGQLTGEPDRVLRPINGEPRRQLADNQVVPYAFLVHNVYEKFPFAGEVRLWYVGRALSIVSGLALISLTYITGLPLFASRRPALLAAACLAFWPAFIFPTSVMTYDGLGAVCTALLLLVGLKLLGRPDGWWGWLALGALAGVAVTVKYTSVLLPLEIILVAWLASSGRVPEDRPATAPSPRFETGLFFKRVILAGLAMLLATSWWFGFVLWHFNTVESKGWLAGLLEPLLVRGGNDSTAISVTAFLLGTESLSVELPGQARERHYGQMLWTLGESFWSAPIVDRFLLSPWLPGLYGLTLLVALVGLWRWWRRQPGRSRLSQALVLLLAHTVLITPLILVRSLLSFDPLEAVQGRHLLFPAATAIPVLLVWGWRQWSGWLAPGLVVGLLLWSGLGQIGGAALVYPRPMPIWTAATHPPDLTGLTMSNAAPIEALRLLGWQGQLSPDGSALEVSLWWQAQAAMAEDYLIELKLSDGAGTLLSYSLAHPLQGRYPTRAWEAGDIVEDRHGLPLLGQATGEFQLELRLLTRAAVPLSPESGLTLGTLSLSFNEPVEPCAVWHQGREQTDSFLSPAYRRWASFVVAGDQAPELVDLQTGRPARQPLVRQGRFYVFVVEPDWGPRYQLRVGGELCRTLAFDLRPRDFTPPEIPTPLLVNFNDEVELIGFNLPTRRIQPGGRLPLDLYWRAKTYIGADYLIFDNILDSQQQRWGGYDRRARDGYSTLLWAPNEVITDRFGVPVAPDAPAGIYTIDLGLYHKRESGPVSLPVLVEGQPTGQTSLRLGPIKIGGPPPNVVASRVEPQIELNQSFGSQITLLGYDLGLGNETGPAVQAFSGDGSPLPADPASPSNSSAGPASLLPLTLYWQAQTIPAADYTVFVHLRDRLNQNVAQQDQPPAQGQYPTSLWDAGEIIVDPVTLPLDPALPAGEYALVVGLYNLATGERLSAPALSNGELHLKTISLP
ncbi:MAG TPA: glycosyltransferase family 39 protein [Anaerolineae bacterium]|nr:glycosyltransferase family 39 protein [Anaerolineae bacterium]